MVSAEMAPKTHLIIAGPLPASTTGHTKVSKILAPKIGQLFRKVGGIHPNNISLLVRPDLTATILALRELISCSSA